MSEQPSKTAPSKEGDLDQQIDSLLTSAAEATTRGNAAPASLGDQLDTLVGAPKAADAPAAKPSEGSAKAEADLAGDDLAKQIQELLDTAKESADGNPSRGRNSSEPAPPAQAVSAKTIERIDEALAENADDAVAGDFETVAETTGQANASPTVSEGAAVQEERRAEEAVPDATEIEPDLEGGFSSPDELMQPAAAGFSATANSVAKELDSQPENAAKPAKRAKPPKVKKPRDPNAPSLIRRTLIVINSPLLRASKQTRDLVGWIGLLTLFNASVLLMARTVFHITGQGSADAAQVDSHAEAGGHGDAKAAKEKHGEGEGHEAKPKAKPEAKKGGKKQPAKAEHGEE